MRMYCGIDPKLIKDQNLRGEHFEYHKHYPRWIKKQRIDKYIKNNCIEPKSYKKRHDEVAEEMVRRGWNHNSPIEQPDFSYLPTNQYNYRIDKDKSFEILKNKNGITGV